MSNNSCFYCTIRTVCNNNNDVTNSSIITDLPTTLPIDQLSLDGTTEKSSNNYPSTTTSTANCNSNNRCNGNGTTSSCNNNTIIQILRPDSEKKSVFWFDPPELISSTETTGGDITVNDDTTSDIQYRKYHTLYNVLNNNDTNNHQSQYYECNLQCRIEDVNDNENNDDNNVSNFMIGGFQLISNAKQIDVYITTPSPTSIDTTTNGNNKNETLLTTIRGIPITSTTDVSSLSTTTTSYIPVPKLYKAQCVIPGGPRLIYTVRLAFHSLFQIPNTAINTPATTSTSPTDTFIDRHDNGNVSNPLYLEYIRWTVRNIVAPTTETTPTNNTSTPTTTTLTAISPNPSMISLPLVDNNAHINNNNSNKNANPYSANTNASNHNNNEVLMALSGMVMTIRGIEDRVQQRMMNETKIIQQQLSNIIQQMNNMNHSIQLIQQQQNEQLLLLQQQQEQIRLLQSSNNNNNNSGIDNNNNVKAASEATSDE